MASSKPTLLFVHGAWHDVRCWNDIRHELESLGYPTVAPSLISMEQKPAVKSHLADVAIVRKELETLVDAGKDVILVMHSYGGMAGGGAVEGLKTRLSANAKGGVKAAVFLAAFLTPKGKSLLGMFEGGSPPYLDVHVSCFPSLPETVSSRSFYREILSSVAWQTMN